MDDSSGDLVRALARAASDQPWLVCLTRRRVATGLVLEPSEGGQRVVLEPLGRAATALLVAAATTSAPLPQHVADELVDRADGNPLFLLELLSALREGGDISSLPSTIEGLISARVDRLAAEDRARLRRVAVLGAGFHGDYLGAVDADDVPVEQTLSRLTEFLASDATGWVTFRHALVRDVAYVGLPYRTRQRLHGQVADSMLANADDGADTDAALLSLHFFHAQRYEETWHYARVAADAARDVYANVEAAKLYVRVLDAARNRGDVPDDERVVVLEALGDVQDRGGMYAGVACGVRRDPEAPRRRRTGDGPGAAEGGVRRRTAGPVRRSRPRDRPRRANPRGRGQPGGRPAAGAAPRLARGDSGQPRICWRARSSRRGTALPGPRSRETTRRGRGACSCSISRRRPRAEPTTGSEPRTRWRSTRRLGDLAGEATASNLLGAAAYYDGRWAEALDWYARCPGRPGEARRPGERRARRLQHHRDPRRPGPARRSGRAHRGRGRDLGRSRRSVGGRGRPTRPGDHCRACGAVRGRGDPARSLPRDVGSHRRQARRGVDGAGVRGAEPSPRRRARGARRRGAGRDDGCGRQPRTRAAPAARCRPPAGRRLRRGPRATRDGTGRRPRRTATTSRSHWSSASSRRPRPPSDSPASSARRAEAAEILRRLDIISVPGYPISSGAAETSTDQINGT